MGGGPTQAGLTGLADHLHDVVDGVEVRVKVFNLEAPGPVEEVHEKVEDDDGEEDSDKDAAENVSRMVLVIRDPGQRDVKGQAEDAKLQEGSEDLQTSAKEDIIKDGQGVCC